PFRYRKVNNCRNSSIQRCQGRVCVCIDRVSFTKHIFNMTVWVNPPGKNYKAFGIYYFCICIVQLLISNFFDYAVCDTYIPGESSLWSHNCATKNVEGTINFHSFPLTSTQM